MNDQSELPDLQANRRAVRIDSRPVSGLVRFIIAFRDHLKSSKRYQVAFGSAVIAFVILAGLRSAALEFFIVALPCILIAAFAFAALRQEYSKYRLFRTQLDALKSTLSLNEDFTSRLMSIRRTCLRNSIPSFEPLAATLVSIINEINPDLPYQGSYKPIKLLLHIDEDGFFRTSLKYTADQIVRIALICTFAGLSYALITTAIALGSVGGQDASEASTRLVRDLIKACSFKFIISTVGLTAAITLRFIESWMRKSVSLSFRGFHERFSEQLEILARQRSRLTSSEHEKEEGNFVQLLKEIKTLLEHNEHVRTSVAEELAAGFQAAASAVRIELSQQVNDALYSRLALLLTNVTSAHTHTLLNHERFLDKLLEKPPRRLRIKMKPAWKPKRL